MAFYNKPLSYCLQQPIIGQQVHLEDTEFVLIEADAQSAALRPIVALITDIATTDSPDTYNAFISAITKGGILIYNEEDTTLSSIVEANENPIPNTAYNVIIYIAIRYGSRILPALALINCAIPQLAGIWFGKNAITRKSELTTTIGKVAIIPSLIARKCLCSLSFAIGVLRFLSKNAAILSNILITSC